MASPETVPTLQVHGALDGCVLPSSAQGSRRYVEASYRWHLMPGVGHFPQEEDPSAFTAVLRDWLADPSVEHEVVSA